MTWKDGISYYVLDSKKCVYSQQMFLSNGKCLQMDFAEVMTLKGGIAALCPYHGHLPGFYKTYNKTYNNVCTVSKHSSLMGHPLAFSSYCSCALEWWDVRMPGTFLEHFQFSRHIAIYINFNESRC